MGKKILAFICKGKEFLALRNNPSDPKHGGDFWFVVTGVVGEKESEEEALKREVKEETNLKIKEIFSLNWGSIYMWDNEEQNEKNFVVFVEDGEIRLNEENIEFEWLGLDDFIKRIRWDSDKKELKMVLESAVQRKLFYKQEKVDDYRK